MERVGEVQLLGDFLIAELPGDHERAGFVDELHHSILGGGNAGGGGEALSEGVINHADVASCQVGAGALGSKQQARLGQPIRFMRAVRGFQQLGQQVLQGANLLEGICFIQDHFLHPTQPVFERFQVTHGIGGIQ